MKYVVALFIALLVGWGGYEFCKARDPARIGTIEHHLVSVCINSYQTCMPVYSYDGKQGSTHIQCTTHCSQYQCQDQTVKIGKHIWNDDILDVKELYLGSCRTTGGGW